MVNNNKVIRDGIVRGVVSTVFPKEMHAPFPSLSLIWEVNIKKREGPIFKQVLPLLIRQEAT